MFGAVCGVLLQTQTQTGTNWGKVSVYQTASKIVACWSERKLTTVHWARPLPSAGTLLAAVGGKAGFLLDSVAVNHRGASLLAVAGGLGSAILVLIHMGLWIWLIHNGWFPGVRSDWSVSRWNKRFWLVVRATSLSDNARFWQQPRPLVMLSCVVWLWLAPVGALWLVRFTCFFSRLVWKNLIK